MTSDSKEIWEEKIPLEQWPRLTEEINQPLIDTASIPSLDIDELKFYPHSTIKTFARNLGISDEGKYTSDVLRGEIAKLHSKRESTLPRIAVSAKVILFGKTARSNAVNFQLFVDGRCVMWEIRGDNGNLLNRTTFSDGHSDNAEMYVNGILFSKFYREEDKKMGPHYYYDDSIQTGIVRYFLLGQQVSKQQWLRYIEESKLLVKKAPSLVADVGALINSYIVF